MARNRSKRQQMAHRSPLGRLVLPAFGTLALVVSGLLAILVGPDLSFDGESAIPREATVATDVLNVRAGPSTDAAILGGLVAGDSVAVIGEIENGFAPVRFGEGYGWLAEAYLDFGDGPAVDEPVQLEFPAREVAAAEVATEPAPIAPPAALEPTVGPVAAADPVERWIDIDRSTVTVTLYEGDTAVASFAGKIGRDPAADGFYSTAIGTYHVYSMNKGLSPTPFAEDTYLTDWVGFDPVRKNGIHSPVRDKDGNEKAWQNATTLGCVRLEAAAAETVFAFAEIGMRVEVHE